MGNTDLTSVDAAGRQLLRELLGDGADALRGQAVLPGGQHAHHKLEQAGSHVEVGVKEDAPEEGAEETVDHVRREALLLHAQPAECVDLHLLMNCARRLILRAQLGKPVILHLLTGVGQLL